MKVYNPKSDGTLNPGLLSILEEFRRKRNFDPNRVIQAKAALLNDYMKKCGLKSCVVAVSGGIDSAVVLGLARYAQQQPGSPIEEIVPLLMPSSSGMTNIESSVKRGVETCEAFGLKSITHDLSDIVKMVAEKIEGATGYHLDNWTLGQLPPVVRTLMNYGHTYAESANGKPSILLGTTNRDEGSYLGYVGKPSDAMVDVQMITDMHKSEVRAVAQLLGVPQSVLDVAPAGDMYDGRVDEEVFGAPYDFVELYLNYKNLSVDEQNKALSKLHPEEREQFDTYARNLERLHSYNAHKYKQARTGGDSPALHLDVYPSAVKGGWSYGPINVEWHAPSDTSKMNGYFDMSAEVLGTFDHLSQAQAKVTHIKGVNDPKNPLAQASSVVGLLSKRETEELLAHAMQQEWIPVSEDGNFKKKYQPGDKVGSYRITAFNVEFANILWDRIQNQIPSLLVFEDGQSSDANGSLVWRAVGVNPALRFIRYEDDCSLVTHYDSPFDFGDGKRTLKSMVLYLTEGSEEQGGLTRFIEDAQDALEPSQRDYSDWNRPAKDEEVIHAVVPVAGDGVVFDHRLLHDSSPYRGGGRKVIIRTDIVYQQVSTPVPA